MNINEMIEVLEAYRDGKAVEYTHIGNDNYWCELKRGLDITPNFDSYIYRIKKEPLECYVVVGYDGVVYSARVSQMSAEMQANGINGTYHLMREVTE